MPADHPLNTVMVGENLPRMFSLSTLNLTRLLVYSFVNDLKSDSESRLIPTIEGGVKSIP